MRARLAAVLRRLAGLLERPSPTPTCAATSPVSFDELRHIQTQVSWLLDAWSTDLGRDTLAGLSTEQLDLVARHVTLAKAMRVLEFGAVEHGAWPPTGTPSRTSSSDSSTD